MGVFRLGQKFLKNKTFSEGNFLPEKSFSVQKWVFGQNGFLVGYKTHFVGKKGVTNVTNVNKSGNCSG